LEETIRVHEQNLQNLQAAHRHAADECLMLRYKNSLLERILLEKGRKLPTSRPNEHMPGGRRKKLSWGQVPIETRQTNSSPNGMTSKNTS
jgi:hypothetical protein